MGIPAYLPLRDVLSRPKARSEGRPSGDDLARVVRVEDAPDDEMGAHLPPALLLVGRVAEADRDLVRAEREHGEARAREVLAELPEEPGIPDSNDDGPQCPLSIGRKPRFVYPGRGLSWRQRL